MKSAAKLAKRPSLLAAFTMLLAVAAATSLGSFVDDASAAIDETALRLGSEVLAFPGVTSGESRALRINGTDFHYRVASVAMPLSEAWAHYASVCSSRLAAATTLEPLVRAIAVRGASSKGQAYVACLDLHRADLPSLARLAQKVVETRDLSHLGALRYVYARRDEADPVKTLLFSMWTDGPLDLRGFVLSPGEDAPGDDPQHVPRPSGSHRILSLEQTSERLAVYRVPSTTPESEADWFGERFRSSGWQVVRSRGEPHVDTGGPLLVFAERDSVTASVVLSRASDGSTLVTAHETESL